MRARAFVVAVVVCGVPLATHAADRPVSNTTELANAIATANAGDTITLADGTYDSTGLSCQRPGTPSAPITVRAATPRGATIRFDAVEGFKVSGDYWHFEGLVVRGVCAVDSDCEHGFHVNGARGFALRSSQVIDFNAQLKVNTVIDGATKTIPHDGIVENNELFDTHARDTENPTTKLNIDSGDDWIVRNNFVHDFEKGAGDHTSYGVFLKCGGNRGIVERNLVLCARDFSGGARIGLSLGGGGCAPQFCQPSFDSGISCVEHHDGIVRNNIVANCSDTGIYVNASTNSRVWFNTVIGAGPIDFRYAASTGEARGNLSSGAVRNRDGATATLTDNRVSVALADFMSWYRDPLNGDLGKLGDWSTLTGGGPTITAVTDDYCGRTRAVPYDVGALQHSLGDCTTTVPGPVPDLAGAGPNDLAAADLAATIGAGDLAANDLATTQNPDEKSGCSCRTSGDDPMRAWSAWALLLALTTSLRAAARRRTR